jgi:hypothetical protein
MSIAFVHAYLATLPANGPASAGPGAIGGHAAPMSNERASVLR